MTDIVKLIRRELAQTDPDFARIWSHVRPLDPAAQAVLFSLAKHSTYHAAKRLGFETPSGLRATASRIQRQYRQRDSRAGAKQATYIGHPVPAIKNDVGLHGPTLGSLKQGRVRTLLLAFSEEVPTQLHPRIRFMKDEIHRCIRYLLAVDQDPISLSEKHWAFISDGMNDPDPGIASKQCHIMTWHPNMDKRADEIKDFYRVQAQRFAEYERRGNTSMAAPPDRPPLLPAERAMRLVDALPDLREQALSDHAFVHSNAGYTMGTLVAADPAKDRTFHDLVKGLAKGILTDLWKDPLRRRSSVHNFNALCRLLDTLAKCDNTAANMNAARVIRHLLRHDSEVHEVLWLYEQEYYRYKNLRPMVHELKASVTRILSS